MFKLGWSILCVALHRMPVQAKNTLKLFSIMPTNEVHTYFTEHESTVRITCTYQLCNYFPLQIKNYSTTTKRWEALYVKKKSCIVNFLCWN